MIPDAERLDSRNRESLDMHLAVGNPDGQLFGAWQAKENVWDLYTLWGEPAVAGRWIDAMIDEATPSTVPEIKGPAGH